MINLTQDKLEKKRWKNLPIKNPTQTDVRRFLNNPAVKLESDFTRGAEEWNKFKKELFDLFNKFKRGELQ